MRRKPLLNDAQVACIEIAQASLVKAFSSEVSDEALRQNINKLIIKIGHILADNSRSHYRDPEDLRNEHIHSGIGHTRRVFGCPLCDEGVGAYLWKEEEE